MSNKLNYYRSELKSKNVAKYKLIGITTELILNTSIFSRNEDIVPFLKTIYKLTYKEYIIKSRTMILARTARDIYKMDNKEYETLRKKLLDFVNGYIELSAQNKEFKTSNSDFSKWMDGITHADR
jgi:septum formation topological specificity factor MinE